MVKIARAVVPLTADGIVQVVYYDEGVGTHWGLDRLIGGGFGHGLSKKIVEAYRFLVHNYAAGDELYFFGFSRGAYTARSLAGLINLIGLLPKDHAFFIPEGYALYRRRAEANDVESFRHKHESRGVRIHFVGVWDTVGALGIPVGIFNRFTGRRYEFHQVGLAPAIEHAYQALAIDERRRPFQPALWHGAKRSGQVLEQVWFAGVHTNIGGGYDKDGLANIPLHWLKEKGQELGLAFDEPFLEFYRPWFNDELRKSFKGIYRLMGPRPRSIGTTDGNESVHPSALKRMESLEEYEPRNLIEYLARIRTEQ